MVAQQAENGMNAKNTIVAEIEGDGSRDYNMGIGEIHTDKDFNIKTVAAGANTHEDDGLKVVMSEGDVVFPTQTSKKEYKKVLSDIRRYKLYGDERAKKRLIKRRDSLPTDEDYGYAENGLHYPDGNSGLDPKYTFDGVGEPDNPDIVEGGSRSGTFDEEMEKTIRSLRATVDKDKLTKEEWNALLDEGLADSPFTKQDVWSYLGNQGDDVGTFNSDNTGIGKLSQRYSNAYRDPGTKKTAVAKEVPKATKQKKAKEKDNKEKEAGSGSSVGSKIWQGANNVAKYSNIANNMIKGMSPAEKVTRRQVEGEFQDYRDMSHQARADVRENRNFMMRQAQNRASRSGQLGTNAQLAAQYARNMERINEHEAQRRWQTDAANTQLTNELNRINTQIAREDDDKDAMNRAARAKYQDTAMAELAEIAQYNEQAAWAKQLDAAKMAQDQESLKYLGTRRYHLDESDDIAFRDPTATAEDGLHHKGKKKKKQLGPGDYTMLPDGTIILS